jgi:predicted ester cyclase
MATHGSAITLEGEISMDHAASMRRFFELINAGDIDGFVDGLLADDFVEHETMPGLPPDREGTRQQFKMIQAAFPNMQWDPQDILVDADKAVARVQFTGTNDGEFMGMPATGKDVIVQMIDIVRFGEDGLAREHWGVFDQMGMMVQLGAVPGPTA